MLGVFLIFVYWGQIVGWGTSILTGSGSNTLVNSPDLPGLAIAHRVWGAGWVFVLAAMFTSTIAVCQATNNVSTRMWYKMGETGTLPKWFAKVHPTYRTPVTSSGDDCGFSRASPVTMFQNLMKLSAPPLTSIRPS